MRRIFIAIDISGEARRAATAHIEALRVENPKLGVGWERPEKFHLTVKFLGDIDEGKMSSLREAVRQTANKGSVIFLRLGGCGVFPSGKRAKVLWLGVEDISGAFHRMHEILENECERLGFAREKRVFKPHLTLARLREPERSAFLVKKHLQTHFEPVGFEASEIVIYESRLQLTGSIYVPVERYRLG